MHLLLKAWQTSGQSFQTPRWESATPPDQMLSWPGTPSSPDPCARVMWGEDNKNTSHGPGRLKNSNSSRRDTSSIQTIFRPFFWILFGTFRFAAVKAQSTWWIGTRGRHVWSNWKTQASVNPGVKTCNQAVYYEACLTPPKLKRMNNRKKYRMSTEQW